MNNKYQEIVSKIIYVSRLSKSTNKKIATFNVVFLANISAFLDIIIILSIANIFSNNISKNQFIVEYLDFYNSL